MRLFFGGQAVSLVGTWMQSVALQWLVWRTTGSEAALGTVAFLSQIPVLILGAWGGSIADRLPRRKLVIATQTAAALQAFAMAAVTFSGVVRPLHVYLLAAMLGVIWSFDIPARQALLADMAGEEFGNAIALNSSVVNGARLIGPALAGAIVAALGEGLCFFLNGVSYLAIIFSLFLMRFPPQPPAASRKGHLREGLRYALETPHARALLLMLSITSIFGMGYLALMPVFADKVLGGGAGRMGWLLASSGVGALLGATTLLRMRGLAGLGRRVAWGSTMFAVGVIGFALSKNVWLSEGALGLTGFGFMLQLASTNTLLQGLAPPAFRGRIMGVFSSMFVGSAPLGALASGWLAERMGAPRTALIGGAITLAASGVFHLALPGLRKIVLRDFPVQFAPQPESAV